MIKGNAQAIYGSTEQTDIRPGEYNPDGSDNIPGDQQGQCNENQADGGCQAFFRHH